MQGYAVKDGSLGLGGGVPHGVFPEQSGNIDGLTDSSARWDGKHETSQLARDTLLSCDAVLNRHLLPTGYYNLPCIVPDTPKEVNAERTSKSNLRSLKVQDIYEEGPKNKDKHDKGLKMQDMHEKGPKIQEKHEGPEIEDKHDKGPKIQDMYKKGSKVEDKHEMGPKIQDMHEKKEKIAPPTPPYAITVLESVRDSMVLGWKQPKFQGGSDITGYFVDYREIIDGIPGKWKEAHIKAITERAYR
eukprot:g42912.t1